MRPIPLLLLITSSAAFIAKKPQKNGAIESGVAKRRFEHSEDIEHDPETLAHDADHHARLGDWVKRNARQHIPIRFPRKSVEVHVAAGLYQVVDLDQKNNLATVSGYLDVWWIDEFIRWNSSQYGGLKRMYVPLKWMWKPEFYMYHSVASRVPDYPPDAQAEVNNDGRVRIFVSISSKTFCPINFKRFPFDSQTCSFSVGSWTYQADVLRFVVRDEIDLGDFFDNQEWLLMDSRLFNGTTRNLMHSNESFSMVFMELHLKRQSFYYVFNLVFPTTLVSLVAIIGFHAPINATGKRESKFRLGIMTLLSMSVMLLMLVGEMKFAMESVPGQRGSFSDVPLLGIYYMTLIFIISVATCTSSVFVHLEKFALRHPSWQAVPCSLRWLAAKHLICCFTPTPFRHSDKQSVAKASVSCNAFHDDCTSSLVATDVIPVIAENVDFTQVNCDAPLHDVGTGINKQAQQLGLIVSLIRELLAQRAPQPHGHLAAWWERIIRRLELCSLTFYLSLIAFNLFLFLFPDLWY